MRILYYQKNFKFGMNNQTYIKKYNRRKIKALRNILLLPSIKSIPKSRIEKIFSGWRKTSNNKYYYLPNINYFTEFEKKRYFGSNDKKFKPLMATSSELIFIDDIKSINHLEEKLQKIIDEIIESKITIIYPDKR